VGRQLLKLAAAHAQNGLFSRGALIGRERLFGDGYSHMPGTYYPQANSLEIELAAAEDLEWLVTHLLVLTAPQPNISFLRLSRRGQKLVEDDAAFENFVSAFLFPKTLLHVSIADEVWIQLSQGKLAVAVFIAFRAVEEAVRKAAGFDIKEHGLPMIRRAFNKESGPLTRLSDPEAEREALGALFTGALGSYKNPHSHRTVEITDVREAQEMVLLASHLLRIVDDRCMAP
jgi:uncharacterized protein (TIGR02391 family)